MLLRFSLPGKYLQVPCNRKEGTSQTRGIDFSRAVSRHATLRLFTREIREQAKPRPPRFHLRAASLNFH